MSTDEANDEKPTHCYSDETMCLLEILQGAHVGGATVEYGSLLLTKDRTGEQQVRASDHGSVTVETAFGPEIYVVTDADNEEIIDAINVWAFKSASDLRAFLDDLDRDLGCVESPADSAERPGAVVGGPGRDNL